MNGNLKRTLGLIVAGCGAVVLVPTSVEASQPICSGIVGEVHGHHVVGDYVTGVGHDDLPWPPAGQASARGGAALPGGPGPGFHFPNGFAPGASFCNGQSHSPGVHLDG